MVKIKIVVRITMRAVAAGIILGAVVGLGFGVWIGITGAFFTVPLGMGIGALLGVVNGAIVGILTALFFNPLTHPRRYRLIMMGICALISPFLSEWAVVEAIVQTWVGIGEAQIGLVAAAGLVAALIGSFILTDLYITD